MLEACNRKCQQGAIKGLAQHHGVRKGAVVSRWEPGSQGWIDSRAGGGHETISPDQASLKADVVMVTGVFVFQEKKPSVTKGLPVKHKSASGVAFVPNLYLFIYGLGNGSSDALPVNRCEVGGAAERQSW